MKLFIFVVILSYTAIPNLYYRKFSKNILKKIPSNKKAIALTFDDGPDPRYTVRLLDLLKKNNIKCTFFVLAEKAEEYPYIIKRIKEDGHCIGLHSLEHDNDIFKMPIKTKKDFSKSLNIMQHLGLKVKLFRPPWGIFNPFTFYCAKVNNIRVVLWSKYARDWSRWVTADYIKDRLINNVRPGDIILLHDGRGAKNAPERTIKALNFVLPKLKKEGYNFVTLNDSYFKSKGC
ncbi:MAG: polysaccharide deacetylase family protein [Clostridium sp.]|nr:polysaccharide deacetylase family protein [Clostridium sp.]